LNPLLTWGIAAIPLSQKAGYHHRETLKRIAQNKGVLPRKTIAYASVKINKKFYLIQTLFVRHRGVLPKY